MSEDTKIVSICPACPGWKIVYTVENGMPFWDDVALWALIEDEGDGIRCVVGMAGGDSMEYVENSQNFLGYSSPSDSLDDWKTYARERRAHISERTRK